MKDLGYPEDAVRLVRNIYAHSNTIFTGEHFGQTQKIPIQRGTIQGDTLSPYLFIIFLEPLLRWLQNGKLGYTLGTSKVTINSATYADDLAIITNKLTSLQSQLNKLDKYCEWAGMDLDITKCAITGCPNKSKMNQETFKAQIQATNITYRNQPIPVLHQNEPYVYLGIQLIPSLKWKIQTHATTTKLINQCSQLANCPATIKQKIKMVDTVIRAGIAYSFYAVPYSLPAIIKLDKKIIAIQKKICGLPKCTPNIVTQLPHNMFGIEVFSLKNAYLRCIGEQLRNALNDKGRLGIIYRGITHFILAKHGGVENIPRIKHQDCIRSPTTRTLFLIKKAGGAHLRSNNDNFPLKATPLEQIWCQLSANQLPQIHPTQNLKILHKLLLHNIYEIKHITLPNGTNLMTQEDFQKFYTKPTILIKQALDIAEQLFCYPRCNPTCQTPCDNHHSPRTLKEEYTIQDHNITPRTTETPIHPPTPPHPPQPPPPPNIKNNPTRYPIHSIIDHKEIKTKDKYKITKEYRTFLCQWRLSNNIIFNKWMPQRDIFPLNLPHVVTHNTSLLEKYYSNK